MEIRMLSALAGAVFVWFMLAAVAALALGAFIQTGNKPDQDEVDAADYASPEGRTTLS
jgi:hypothetical protein